LVLFNLVYWLSSHVIVWFNCMVLLVFVFPLEYATERRISHHYMVLKYFQIQIGIYRGTRTSSTTNLYKKLKLRLQQQHNRVQSEIVFLDHIEVVL